MYIVYVDGTCLLYTSLISVSVAEALARRGLSVTLLLSNPLEDSYCTGDGRNFLCVNMFENYNTQIVISNIFLNNFSIKIFVYYPILSIDHVEKVLSLLEKHKRVINVVPVVRGVEGYDSENNVCFVKVRVNELCINLDRLILIGSKLSKNVGIEDLVEELLVRLATISQQ